MSLVLDNQGTDPLGIEIKTHGLIPEIVMLTKHKASGVGLEISVDFCLEDFFLAAAYVLTNIDLYHNQPDPRLEFVKFVKAMSAQPSPNPDRLRLQSRKDLYDMLNTLAAAKEKQQVPEKAETV